MAGSYLLDTNVVIALFAGDMAVHRHLMAADEIYVPSIVIGELSFGALKSGRPAENLARVEEFAANNVVLGCDSETALRYGAVKAALHRAGRPIPENDIWIAAIALQHEQTLVTDDAHFSAIEGLSSTSWTD